ncbi:hypothetical protein Pla22_50950 [Rubripirellula amarantea]|uniref:Uncharacterized protein n=1 Tax=Rubripirellula amarantea TaxID=2527999 RepID=A0A5C5WBS9_9BACT|nr:hypothetical protein Pla22_50950 [Rubripirellula amarantea]
MGRLGLDQIFSSVTRLSITYTQGIVIELPSPLFLSEPPSHEQ